MYGLFEKVMALDEREIERIEREESELIQRLGAKKMHEFDNVAEGVDGRLYALEELNIGDDIVKCGELFGKAKAHILCGEVIE